MEHRKSLLNSYAKDKTFRLDLRVTSAYSHLASRSNYPYKDRSVG